jgi:hypothetical protein
METLKNIEKLISSEDLIDLGRLQKAYEQILRLRSQLIGVIYDIEQYVEQDYYKNDYTYQNMNNEIVILKINEPLPSLKELTASVEEHWINMIHKVIEEISKNGIPKYEKAFVLIEITTPKGSKNVNVWDTSNRAINVIINNLKGVFFKDDDFEHLACGIVANWGEVGETVIKICDFKMLSAYQVFNTKIEKL